MPPIGCRAGTSHTGSYRTMRMLLFAVVAVIAGLAIGVHRAAAAVPQSQSTQKAGPTRTVVTHHAIMVHGKAMKYTAHAGYITLRDHSRQPRAKIFFVAYSLDRAGNASPRPLTFLWNGGPGSPASMVELGMAGPRRAKLADEYKTPPPPYQLVDNEDTWLPFTDLVFVDPVGTGYSYPIKPAYGPEFWNTQGDIDSIAEFIRIYRERYERTQSPLFIGGESYGTLRAAGLARTLEEGRESNFAGGSGGKIPLKGVILLSGSLNFSLTAGFKPGNDLPYILYLPSYTATAFVHKKLSPELESNFHSTLQKAKEWAMTDYATALLQGDRLPAARRDAIAKQLARYTGLDLAFVKKCNLRVNLNQFASHLLGNQGLAVGHYDTQVTYKAPAGAPYNVLADKSLFGDGIGSLIVPYLRDELGFKTDAYYSGPFTYGWPPPATPRGDWLAIKWNHGSSRTLPDESTALAKAIQQNPALHVFWASGYFDPGAVFASQYVFDHMSLDAAQQARVEMKDYPGGHMIYLSGENRRRLSQDIKKFIESALSAASAHHGN